jgi:hypothetical protein
MCLNPIIAAAAEAHFCIRGRSLAGMFGSPSSAREAERGPHRPMAARYPDIPCSLVGGVRHSTTVGSRRLSQDAPTATIVAQRNGRRRGITLGTAPSDRVPTLIG